VEADRQATTQFKKSVGPVSPTLVGRFRYDFLPPPWWWRRVANTAFRLTKFS